MIKEFNFEAYIDSLVRKTWNTVAMQGTKSFEKDYSYFQRILEPFHREVKLAMSSVISISRTMSEESMREKILNAIETAEKTSGDKHITLITLLKQI